MPHELTRNNNNKSLFWSVIFSYSTQQLLTISPSDCDVRCKVGFIRWLSVSSSVVRLRRSSKPLSKAKLAPKKWSWPLFGGLLSVLSTIVFLNPSKTIAMKYAQQINKMLWKLQCLQPALVNSKGPILPRDNTRPDVTQPTLQKLNDLLHLP